MEFGSVISALGVVLSGGTQVSLHVHVSFLCSTWLASKAGRFLVPTPSPPSAPVAVTSVVAGDRPKYHPLTLNQRDGGEAGQPTTLCRTALQFCTPFSENSPYFPGPLSFPL